MQAIRIGLRWVYLIVFMLSHYPKTNRVTFCSTFEFPEIGRFQKDTVVVNDKSIIQGI